MTNILDLYKKIMSGLPDTLEPTELDQIFNKYGIQLPGIPSGTTREDLKAIIELYNLAKKYPDLNTVIMPINTPGASKKTKQTDTGKTGVPPKGKTIQNNGSQITNPQFKYNDMFVSMVCDNNPLKILRLYDSSKTGAVKSSFTLESLLLEMLNSVTVSKEKVGYYIEQTIESDQLRKGLYKFLEGNFVISPDNHNLMPSDLGSKTLNP